MITEAFLPFSDDENSSELRIRLLKEKIDDKNYLSDAIQRIALVLSNEITGANENSIKGNDA
jgi:hypothetical protein